MAVGLTLATSCSGSESGQPVAEGGGDSANKRAIASADEVIEVVDLGFVTYRVTGSSGYQSDYLSYGFVIENVSDEVALSVRVEADFTDEAGNLVEDAHGGEDFTVVLPGQRMGSGGSNTYEGPVIADMEVRVTMIGSLDTPGGDRHRNPPAPYAELRTSNPVGRPNGDESGEVITLEVTNTYDVPLTPKVTGVVRDTDGVIVGGMGNNAMDQEIPPGDSAKAKVIRDIKLPRIAEGTSEFYADPVLGWIVSTDPVWDDLG